MSGASKAKEHGHKEAIVEAHKHEPIDKDELLRQAVEMIAAIPNHNDHIRTWLERAKRSLDE
jgi:hypothetical protein